MRNKILAIVYYIFVRYLVQAQSNVAECEREGFAVVESTSCASYYYCVRTSGNALYQVLFTCPTGEGFSLETLKCIPKEDNLCGKIPEISGDEPILSEEFVCPSQGKFPDYSSIDCKSYYTCASNLIPTLNTCPSNTIFSWTSTKCVMPDTFTCPNSIVTTTEEITTSTTAHTTSSPSNFECIATGRFPDPEDVDCKGYYLCTTTISGTLEATLYQCSSTTVFSPITSKCVTSESYECPQSTTPATTSLPSESTVIIVTSEETDEVTTTRTDEQTTTIDAVTTEVVTETPTQPPTTQETTEPAFTCTGSGRFPNPESKDCKTYYLCTVDVNGAYEATINQCPSVTVFDPEKVKCVMPGDYVCPQEGTTTTEPITTMVTTTEAPTTKVDTFVCTGTGRFPDPNSSDCKSYYLCSDNGDGTFNTMLSKCPTITIFSLDSLRCVLPTQYQCPSVITSTQPLDPTTVKTSTTTTTTTITTTIATTTDSTTGFICSSVGRHPDTTQAGCTKYKFCILTATNEFLEYTFSCAAGTFFDPMNLRCSQNYICPSQETTAATTTSTEATTPSAPTPFVCTSNGRFPDPSIVGCGTYIMCSITATGSYQQFSFKCPSSTLFSQSESKCVINYVCRS